MRLPPERPAPLAKPSAVLGAEPQSPRPSTGRRSYLAFQRRVRPNQAKSAAVLQASMEAGFRPAPELAPIRSRAAGPPELLHIPAQQQPPKEGSPSARPS